MLLPNKEKQSLYWGVALLIECSHRCVRPSPLHPDEPGVAVYACDSHPGSNGKTIRSTVFPLSALSVEGFGFHFLAAVSRASMTMAEQVSVERDVGPRGICRGLLELGLGVDLFSVF